MALINVALLAAIFHLGWKAFPVRWKRHLRISLIINIPLYLTLCWLDELRNLSLLFVAFTVLIACALHRATQGSTNNPPCVLIEVIEGGRHSDPAAAA